MLKSYPFFFRDSYRPTDKISLILLDEGPHLLTVMFAIMLDCEIPRLESSKSVWGKYLASMVFDSWLQLTRVC